MQEICTKPGMFSHRPKQLTERNFGAWVLHFQVGNMQLLEWERCEHTMPSFSAVNLLQSRS